MSISHTSGMHGALSRSERVQGAIVGMLVGDALGVPYEFHAPNELPLEDNIEMEPPPGFRRAHGVPPGTWSDDGTQALCQLDSLLEKGRFDPSDFVDRLMRWIQEGYLTVDGHVFGVDAQTLGTLRAIRQGTTLMNAAAPYAGTAANGCLTRVVPLALLDQGSDFELVKNVHLQSQLTHLHPRCRVSCALCCLWVRYELDGRVNAWEGARRRLGRLYERYAPFRWDAALRSEFATHYGSENPSFVAGSTDVADSLKSAVAACEAQDFEPAVRRAVAFGRASGATACLAGAIAGVRNGTAGIPDRWLNALRGRGLLAPLLEQLATPTGLR